MVVSSPDAEYSRHAMVTVVNTGTTAASHLPSGVETYRNVGLRAYRSAL